MPGFGPRKASLGPRESKVIKVITFARALNDHLAYPDVGRSGIEVCAFVWAAVIRLSKSGRAVRRGVEIFYAF